jgi:hypothetical protein
MIGVPAAPEAHTIGVLAAPGSRAIGVPSL